MTILFKNLKGDNVFVHNPVEISVETLGVSIQTTNNKVINVAFSITLDADEAKDALTRDIMSAKKYGPKFVSLIPYQKPQ